MHIGGVAVFEGPAPAQAELLAHIERRLELVPRFRQRLASAPLPLARPWWVDDPDFNLDYHLRRSSLARPGGPRQLQAMVARVFSQRLDRARPLWEMYLVEGFEGGRFVLITKVHHALVDGISGLDLASVILDTDPEPEPRPPDAGGRWLRHPAPSRAELTLRAAIDGLRAPIALASEAAGLLMYPRRPGYRLSTLARTAQSVGSQLLDPAPRLPLNGSIGPHRRFEMRHFSLERVRHVKERVDATVNDVVLAIVTGALRSWLSERSVDLDGLAVRALVPVSLRSDADRGLLGNRLAVVRATLPVGVADPGERLTLIRDAMAELKRSRHLAAARTIIDLSDFAPPTILAQASRLNFSTRLFNLIVTNVPGPQQPLYLRGRRMQTITPVAFLPPGHGLSVAAFSYDGTVSFGLLGDLELLHDLGVFADGLEAALADLDSS